MSDARSGLAGGNRAVRLARGAAILVVVNTFPLVIVSERDLVGGAVAVRKLDPSLFSQNDVVLKLQYRVVWACLGVIVDGLSGSSVVRDEVRKVLPLLLGVHEATTSEVLPVADGLITVRVDRVGGLDGSELLLGVLRVAVFPVSRRLLGDLMLVGRDTADGIPGRPSTVIGGTLLAVDGVVDVQLAVSVLAEALPDVLGDLTGSRLRCKSSRIALVLSHSAPAVSNYTVGLAGGNDSVGEIILESDLTCWQRTFVVAVRELNPAGTDSRADLGGSHGEKAFSSELNIVHLAESESGRCGNKGGNILHNYYNLVQSKM